MTKEPQGAGAAGDQLFQDAPGPSGASEGGTARVWSPAWLRFWATRRRRCTADGPQWKPGAECWGPTEIQGVQDSEAKQAGRPPGGGGRPAGVPGAQAPHYLGCQARAEGSRGLAVDNIVACRPGPQFLAAPSAALGPHPSPDLTQSPLLPVAVGAALGEAAESATRVPELHAQAPTGRGSARSGWPNGCPWPGDGPGPCPEGS